MMQPFSSSQNFPMEAQQMHLAHVVEMPQNTDLKKKIHTNVEKILTFIIPFKVQLCVQSNPSAICNTLQWPSAEMIHTALLLRRNNHT